MEDGDEIERAPLLEFRNDHGPACTCLSCVVNRGERRIEAAEALLSTGTRQ